MFLQDPANGGNPIMQRVSPILQANIQEHVVMKYQEQINGMTQNMIAQAPQKCQRPKSCRTSNGSSSTTSYDGKSGNGTKGGTPEQQMVMMEAQRLGIEKRKTASKYCKRSF